MPKARYISCCKLHWLWLSLVVILIDQLSKYFVAHYFAKAPYPLLSWLTIDLNFNRGVAFGLLSGLGGRLHILFIVLLPIVILLLVTIWLLHTRKPPSFWQKIESFSLAILLGGGISNLFDRLIHGYVCDFISFHIGGWYFAIFNLADSFISIGLVLLILVFIRQSLFCSR